MDRWLIIFTNDKGEGFIEEVKRITKIRLDLICEGAEVTLVCYEPSRTPQEVLGGMRPTHVLFADGNYHSDWVNYANIICERGRVHQQHVNMREKETK